MTPQADALRLLFVAESYNQHSLAALCGALEVSGLEDSIRVAFCSRRELSSRIETGPRPAPTVVAWSFHTPNLVEVADALSVLRWESGSRKLPVWFVAGGAHPSGDPRGTLDLGFDGVLTGEGELSLAAYLQAVLGRLDFGSVPGLVWRADGQVRRNPRGPAVELDRFPPISVAHRRFAPLEISRGCGWGCRFCQTWSLLGREVRHRSVAVIAHWAEVAKAHRQRYLRFVSPDALAYGVPAGQPADPARIEELLEAVNRVFRREEVFFGSFPSEARPESVTPETMAVVRRLAVNDNIVIGAQSGSDRMLERLHRGHGVAEVVRAVEVALAAGIRPIVDFIHALPGETEADRQATFNLIERLIGLGALVHCHSFMPLPGTPLARCNPRPVDPDSRRRLLSLAGRGNLFGQWQAQERLARKIEQFQKEDKP